MLCKPVGKRWRFFGQSHPMQLQQRRKSKWSAACLLLTYQHLLAYASCSHTLEPSSSCASTSFSSSS